MTCSPAQLAANRENAQKSTGPRTPEGKARSRANSLKHGLCASAVVAEDLALVQKRSYEYYYTLKPQNEYQSWVVDKIALLSIRIDRAERMERRYRDRKSLRAELAWDEDRKLEVEALGGKLTRRPAEVVESLKRSTVGCDWLIDRWSLLERAAEPGGAWTPDQSRMAFDLLGMPLEFREGRKPGQELSIQPIGPAELARRELARLLEHREKIAELDEVDRTLTEVDLLDESHPELRSLRRHEATLHGRFRWFHAQLRHESPHHRPHPDLVPRWSLEYGPPPPLETPDEPGAKPSEPEAQVVAPAEPPEAKRPPERWRLKGHSLNPPFDLTPEECPAPGEAVDVPAIVASRLEKKAKKAESRRIAKRRKVERLRA